MELTLPSGAHATLRDDFQRKDRMYAKRALRTVMSPDGSITLDGGTFEDVAARIIRCLTITWDIPGMAPPGQTSEDIYFANIDRLDDDDWAFLARAVSPWVNRVIQSDRGGFLHKETGVPVSVSSVADRDKLAASPDFEALGDEAPKALPTGTSSPVAQDPAGLPAGTTPG